jgi:hypothetical protein
MDIRTHQYGWMMQYMQYHSPLPLAVVQGEYKLPEDFVTPKLEQNVSQDREIRVDCTLCTFGMVIQSLLPSRGESVNQCWREIAASPTERSWFVLEFARCNRFYARSDGNLYVVVTNKTANIPLSNGSNILYICSVFVKIWFCKIPIIYTHPVLL